jgi:hypothetical protein
MTKTEIIVFLPGMDHGWFLMRKRFKISSSEMKLINYPQLTIIPFRLIAKYMRSWLNNKSMTMVSLFCVRICVRKTFQNQKKPGKSYLAISVG